MMIFDVSDAMIGEIAALENLVFSDPWSENLFRAFLHDKNVIFRALLADGAVAGYIIVIFVLETAQIANLAVEPGRLRSGIGGALLDDCISLCRTRGITNLSLEVRRSNLPAQNLYASRGFVSAGLRKNYYRLPREDALVMLLML